ncbi:MAG: preprotein translocase subunit SecA [Flavobacteriales bacterium]
MIQNILKKILGDNTKNVFKDINPLVDQAKEEFAKLNSISNDELRAKTQKFKAKIKAYTAEIDGKINELKAQTQDENTDVDAKDEIFQEIEKLELESNSQLEEVLLEILPEAFAVVKETARRFTENEEIEVTASEFDKIVATQKDAVEIEGDKAIWFNSWTAGGTQVTWGMVHYEVQLIGGVALHTGKIAEMQTGEGKTLVATLPVYLNALAGKGVHMITVNDYLAKRDSEWMGTLYEFHGMSVDCIDKHQPNSDARRKAYNADITFGTNNEFGFDYLRDNMSSEVDSLVQRKHHFAIIDEVDSVLIDDARTPLIISGPTPKGDEQEFTTLKPKVEKLVGAQRKLAKENLVIAKENLAKAEDETLDKKARVEHTKVGQMALLRSHRGMPKNPDLIKYLSEPGIKVQLQKVENFYMQDQSKEMHKVDRELYFVIEEKNNQVDLTEKGIDLISGVEEPDFYILPDLGGLFADVENQNLPSDQTIAKKDEVIRDYTVKAERIHSINQLLKAYTLFEKDTEYVLMDGKVKIVDEQTGRIMEGRRYSDGLHQAIEAKEDVKIEASTQTYATITLQNYFRMYHKLAGMTGTAETEAGEFWDIYKLDVVVIPTNKPIARDDREDLVYKTAREKYLAVSEEIVRLVGENRPVLVGTTSVEISEYLSSLLNSKGIKHNVLNAKKHQQEADIVAEAGKAGAVTIATNMAGRGTDIKLQAGVKEAGGLAIIGTERHDSRRVDRQLRGRAGRQGDPGSSQFFISLEDNLMRLFGSERIGKMMDRMGFKEGEVIQHKMISKSIERAQKKVEENNFGIRKHLLEYDDVMNAQRNSIYAKRKNALYGDKLDLDIANTLYEIAENVVFTAKDTEDFEEFELELIRIMSIQSPVTQEEFLKTNEHQLVETVYQKAKEAYNRKVELMASMTYPVIANVYQNESNSYENIIIPVTDGSKSTQILANLKDSFEAKGKNISKLLERNITLGVIDNEWKEHLREMDDLRQSVRGAQYEQKDPLLIYKLESYELFKQMVSKVNKEIISFLMRANLPQNQGVEQTNNEKIQQRSQPKLQTGRTDINQATQANQQVANQQQNGERIKQQPVVNEVKIGRNDKVTIVNLRSGETKEVKYKQAEPLINEGSWQMAQK